MLRTAARLSRTMPAARNYEDAVEALNTLQSNAAVIASIRGNWASLSQLVVPETVEYWQRLGYKTDDLNALNVIHLAGTKGKGSTAAFASKLLTTLAPTAKIGLYTSPHMVAVRERIRLNDEPISEEMFARYFWEVWDRFAARPERARGEETSLRPAYFRYLTMMAFHVFLQEKVDTVVLEVGIGGLYDSTNIVPKPRVTAITALGLDHVAILGHTLPEIALQKAGIFKTDVPALTVEQPAEPMDVLKTRAEQIKSSSFQIVKNHKAVDGLSLGLAGEHQRSNASLALQAVDTFLQGPLPPAFASAQALQSSKADEWDSAVERALTTASWPGRCQKLSDPHAPSLTWFLDGAHTVDSMICCADWFAREVGGRPSKRVLVFNCTGDRRGAELLEALASALIDRGLAENASGLFDGAVFCPGDVTYSSGATKSDLSNRMTPRDHSDATWLQGQLAQSWRALIANGGESGDLSQGDAAARHAIVLPSIEAAVLHVRQRASNAQAATQALVVGSLHLGGGLLAVLGEDPGPA